MDTHIHSCLRGIVKGKSWTRTSTSRAELIRGTTYLLFVSSNVPCSVHEDTMSLVHHEGRENLSAAEYRLPCH